MLTIVRKIGRILTHSEKKRLGWLMTLDIITSVADIVFLALLLFIVHIYTDTGRTQWNSFLPVWMTDRTSLWPIGVFFAFFCIKNALSFLIFTAQARFRYGVASRISHRNLLEYLEGGFHQFRDTDSSVHILKIAQQPIEFCTFELAGLQQGVTEATLIIVTVIAVLLFNAQLFLLLLALLLPPMVVTAWLTRRRLHTARVYIKSSRDIMWQHLQESIASYVESNLYDKRIFFSDRYGKAQSILNRHLSSLQAMQGAPSRLAEIFAVFGLLALIAIGHFSGNTHSTEFVTLGAFLAAAYKIIPGIARILNITGQMKTYEFTVNGLIASIEAREAAPVTAPVVPGASTAVTVVAAASACEGITPLRSLTCRHIRFHFDKHRIFDDFNLSIRAGDFLGVRGDSGKGKTTLLNIILGFVTPEAGEVMINDVLSSPRDRPQYWSRIAYVKQQPFIIHDTLRVNVTLDETHFDQERLQRSVNLAGLEELIHKLPGGLDGVIAENGKNISGGQRQRIALARALYKDPDLFLLDEPFSELDEASEERLLETFRQLAAGGKIVVMITHNRESLAWCTATTSLGEICIV